MREPIIESSAPENSSRKSFLGENAAVPAESSGERPHRHAVELASRRWRGGQLSAVGGEAPGKMVYALVDAVAAERLAVAPEAHGRVQLEFIY